MGDTTVTKIDSRLAARGAGAEVSATGKNVAMRLWENEPPNER